MLLESHDSQKYKIVYTAGHLVHEYGDTISDAEDETDISSEFLFVLDLKGLSLPVL